MADQGKLRESEGWEVFNSDTAPSIQATIDRDDGGEPLASDMAAVAVVLRGALAGRDHALSALDEVGFMPQIFGESGVVALERALAAVSEACSTSLTAHLAMEMLIASGLTPDKSNNSDDE